MSDKIVSINCSRETKFEGSQVTGTVDFNTRLAREKGITAVKISLKAQMRTRVGNGEGKVRDREPIFKIESTLWSNGSALPDHPYEIVSLPFSLTIPDSADSGKPLPPSLSCITSSGEGTIQYYVHCVAENQAWYKRNTRVNAPFPFLPLDRISAPSPNFGSWIGPWAKTDKTINVRPNTLNIFGSQGSVEVSVYLPQVDSLPLFVRIPCKIHITCHSKPIKSKQTGINDSYDLLGGFGTLQNQADLETKISDPVWVPEEGNRDRGKWMESVNYSTYLILRCPPPVYTRLIRTEMADIEAKIDFPGLGNTWKASTGPISISGVKSPQQIHGDQGSTAYDISLPPSYWEVMGEDDSGSKDEKEKF